VSALQIDQIFDYLGVQINGPMAWKQPEIVINWQLTDVRGQEEYAMMRVRYGALTYQMQERSDRAACTVKLTRPVLAAMVCGQLTPQAAVQTGQIQVDGNVQSLYQMWKLRDVEPSEMPVVTAQAPYDWKKQTP
jgi:alkyl sulfatase BDS1-like metallo-beta-lactamase superfamily hydrolase